MSVKIRLRRMGKKKQPHYRIVVTDSRAPRDGRFVEIVGYYNPIRQPAALKVDLERVEYWVGRGAVLSPTVGSLVSKARAGGDDSVGLAGERADGDAGVEVAAANGDVAEGTAEPGGVAATAAAEDDEPADAAAEAEDAEAEDAETEDEADAADEDEADAADDSDSA